MFDEYVKRVTAQGVQGQQVINDVMKLKEQYEKQFAGK